MAATDWINARMNYGGYADYACINKTGSSIAAGTLLKLDTGNLMGGTTTGTIPQVAVTPCTAVTDIPIGFAAETIPNGQQGRVQIDGVAVGIAAGAITAGTLVGASATAGDVTTYTGNDPAVGMALTTTVNAGDPVFVLMNRQKSV